MAANLPLELTQRESVAVCEAIELTLERATIQLVQAWRDRDESKVRKEAAWAAYRWAMRLLDAEDRPPLPMVVPMPPDTLDEPEAWPEGTRDTKLVIR